MVKRGGGVEDARFKVLGEEEILVVELLVNVCDSMGANVINTIAEYTAPFVADILQQGRVSLRILSNLCTERMTMVEFEIPVEQLAWKNTPGKVVAKRVLEAQRFAELDQYRATTHNKGVMNGMDAVAVALGQDWRAIESAAHSYACISGRYLPLTTYEIRGDTFHGRIEVPISVGSKGGAIASNPSYQNTLMLLGDPNAETLA
jgi:degradative hydroxymethylglutaryl-CoA reductase